MLVSSVLLTTLVAMGMPAPAEAATARILVVGTHWSSFSGDAECDEPTRTGELGVPNTHYEPQSGAVGVLDGGSGTFYLVSFCDPFVALIQVTAEDVNPAPGVGGRTDLDVTLALYKRNPSGDSGVFCGSGRWHRTFFDVPGGSKEARNNGFLQACGVHWQHSEHIAWAYV